MLANRKIFFKLHDKRRNVTIIANDRIYWSLSPMFFADEVSVVDVKLAVKEFMESTDV